MVARKRKKRRKKRSLVRGKKRRKRNVSNLGFLIFSKIKSELPNFHACLITER